MACLGLTRLWAVVIRVFQTTSDLPAPHFPLALSVHVALDSFLQLVLFFKAPKHTHTPQTPTRTALAHSTRTKSTDPVYGVYIIIILYYSSSSL